MQAVPSPLVSVDCEPTVLSVKRLPLDMNDVLRDCAPPDSRFATEHRNTYSAPGSLYAAPVPPTDKVNKAGKSEETERMRPCVTLRPPVSLIGMLLD
jgi:hypothetical protein